VPGLFAVAPGFMLPGQLYHIPHREGVKDVTIEGIDIASHQGPNFNFAAQSERGVEFCIIKASGGHDYQNPFLAQQVQGARDAGMIVGFYAYMFEPSFGTPGNPSGGDVTREVDNFIEAVRPYVEPGTTFWLDVEEYPATVGLSNSVLPAWIAAFCDTVELEFGAVCGVYCATWFQVPTGLVHATELRKYPYWMASWQEEIPDAARMAPWDHLTLHQYDSVAVDKDRFYGTREEFLALGVPAPAPPPAADPIRATTVIGGDGVPVTTIVWGGQATKVLGTSYRDIGVRVENAAGQTFHRSIVDGEGREWVEE
jgi:GH25 family lysozyme M1 (1,4-beta-N-acetylmuramidase)